MSDEGEKTCPLCAEEMDLTDQQLKPCKCGYEICVWCWHQLMDMAEKAETEGRCPACRSPYNKEKIVATAAKCERLVAEMSMEKKIKSQKGKGKISDARKQLSSVRVIQRNLVYIVGLSLNLADEDLLHQKEYFGQYGKVLKVSISRTAAGAIQQFGNNSCSVYITYSKEEEAVRSIQAVHGFVLEGRPLRACFGTTKYCHAWLKNMPCSNPDCLYLHEVGLQEDSFTKDEIISAYTRSRVQQVTGVACEMQRRSGNVLPPPADDYCSNSSYFSGKPVSKSSINNQSNNAKSSPPNGSSGRLISLPAAASWGMRGSNSQPPTTPLSCSNGPSKQKPDSCSGSLAFSTAVVSPILHAGDKKLTGQSLSVEQKSKQEPIMLMDQLLGAQPRRKFPETPAVIGIPSTSTVNSQSCTALAKDKSIDDSFDLPRLCSDPVLEKDRKVASEGGIHDLCSGMASLAIDRPQKLQPQNDEEFREPLPSLTAEKPLRLTREQSDSISGVRSQAAEVVSGQLEDDLSSFDAQKLKDPEVATDKSYLYNLFSDDSVGYSPQKRHVSVNAKFSSPIVDQKIDKGSLSQTFVNPLCFNGYPENLVSDSDSVGNSPSIPSEEDRKHQKETQKVERNTALDIGENGIISNILSMNFDPWEQSLTSPQNLAKLLGETDKQQESLRVSSSWKAQNNNQSRFSFARDEESEASNLEPLNNIGAAVKNRSFTHDFPNDTDIYLDKLSNGNGFSSFNFEESSNYSVNHSPLCSNPISVSRAQISVPPGFSGPIRAPPPGFGSHEKLERTFESPSGNNFFDNSSLLRKTHQPTPTVNIGNTGDIDLADPAIMAIVGNGISPDVLNGTGLDMRHNYHPQVNAFDKNTKFQLMMQRSLSHQNQRYTDLVESFPQRSEAYGMHYRMSEQPVISTRNSYSQLSLPQWDGWNDVPVQSGNDMAMAELLRSERLGFSKFYSGYEDSKFRLPNSGDLYNRTFGI